MSTKEYGKRYRAPKPIGVETADERVRRLYTADGGPLVNWLLDEARVRGIQLVEMAKELGVTYGYINQLRTGIRSPAGIGQEFAEACGRFLGVPPVVVKILAGRILMSDFAHSRESESQLVDRAFRRMMNDPVARKCLPVNVGGLNADARRALVLMYVESSGHDVFNLRELPMTLQYLQRAAVIHDENQGLELEVEERRSHLA